jgi:serine acetyltransferase
MVRSFRFHLFTAFWPWPSLGRLLSAKEELLRVDTVPENERGWSESFFFRRFTPKFLPYTINRFGGYMGWRTKVGRDLHLVHGLNGVHISDEAVIGDRCTLLHNVTIGANLGRGADDPRYGQAPVIGNDVFVGAGAQIIGRCVIGDGARIGAGVVLVNVTIEPGAVIVNRSAYDLTNKRFVYPQD